MRFLTAPLFALAAVVAASAFSASASATTTEPRTRDGMQWFRWHSTRSRAEARRFGSTVVVGLESMRDLASVRARYGLGKVRPIPALRAVEARIDHTRLLALLAGAPSDSRIRYVSPAGPRRRVLGMPDDPLLRTVDPLTGRTQEWQFAASRVDRALDYGPGDPGVVVGVVDTGVTVVPDLAGKVDSLWSVTPERTVVSVPPSVGNDDTGHGTAVASLVAAKVDDGFGMAGFGGASHVIAVRAGYHGFFFETDVAIALTKLDSLGVRIVNLSLGSPSPSKPILIDAIHKAAADGVLLIAAAGNDHGEVSWPAAALQPSGGGRSFGLAVGATDIDGNLASFSSSGKHLSLVAPGTSGNACFAGLLVALPPGTFEESYCSPHWGGDGGAVYGYLAGTSFAAPEVSGVAALIWAARPELRNDQVADILKQSARRTPGAGWTATMGCGILDAGAALELATSRTAAEWAAATRSEPAACSVDGDQPAAWPRGANQTIRFRPLRDKTVSDPDFTIKATATSALPVLLTANGPCAIRAATVHLAGVGVCAITATQPGNTDYHPARPISRTFSVTEGRVERRANVGKRRISHPSAPPYRRKHDRPASCSCRPE
jgi:subtilisin family serine protease